MSESTSFAPLPPVKRARICLISGGLISVALDSGNRLVLHLLAAWSQTQREQVRNRRCSFGLPSEILDKVEHVGQALERPAQVLIADLVDDRVDDDFARLEQRLRQLLED